MERTMIAAALLTLSCMAHNPPDAAPSLTTLSEQARRYDAAHFVYRAPTEDDLAAMRALVAANSADVSKGVAPSARVQPANALGFSLTSQGPLWAKGGDRGVFNFLIVLGLAFDFLRIVVGPGITVGDNGESDTESFLPKELGDGGEIHAANRHD